LSRLRGSLSEEEEESARRRRRRRSARSDVERRLPRSETKMRGNHRKLGRNSSHRIAMLRTMVDQLIQNQRIRTTLAKAKEIKPLADKMVTLGKRVCLLSFF